MHLIKKFLEKLARIETALAVRWVSSAHKRLMLIQWGIKPVPYHFDHHIDLYYKWLTTRNAEWLERGVFSAMVLKGGDVLDLTCGDGFYTRNFYSLASRQVIGCDLDPDAINTAKTKNLAENIEYIVADVCSSMPDGDFQNVIWDFGFPLLDFFSLDEVSSLLRQIKQRVGSDGILSGHTQAKANTSSDTKGTLNQIGNISDLKNILSPFFKYVTVFETCHTERHNLYYWASNKELPFSAVVN